MIYRYILGWNLWFGVVAVIFSLNGVLSYISQQAKDIAWLSTFIMYLSEIPERLYQQLPVSQYFWFELFIRWLLIGFLGYFFLISMASMRCRNLRIIGVSLLGFIFGVFIITWIDLIIRLVGLVIIIHSFFVNLFKDILIFLFTPPVTYIVIPVIIIIASIVFLDYLRKNRMNWRQIFIFGTFLIVGIIVILLLTRIFDTFIWKIFSEWWNEWILPFLAVIWSYVSVPLALIISILVISLIGNQFAEQFKSPVMAGQSVGELFNVSFDLGFTCSIILAICDSNPEYSLLANDALLKTFSLFQSVDMIAFVHAFISDSVRSFFRSVLSSSSLPIFDMICVLISLFLASCSLIMGIMKGITSNTLREVFNPERGLPPILSVFITAAFSIVVAIIDGMANNQASSSE